MAHTAGPWTAVLGGMDAQVRCPDGRSFLVGDIVYHEENKANARLIAAAPELLAALKALRVAAEDSVYNTAPTAAMLHAYEQADIAARAAIRKAEQR